MEEATQLFEHAGTHHEFQHAGSGVLVMCARGNREIDVDRAQVLAMLLLRDASEYNIRGAGLLTDNGAMRVSVMRECFEDYQFVHAGPAFSEHGMVARALCQRVSTLGCGAMP